MEPFVFHHGTKIIFGRRSLAHLGPACAEMGDKVLLLYGQKHCKASGLYQRITEALTAAGVTWLAQGGIRPNPTLEQVRPAIALAREQGVAAVVAVGGGSVMDSAKAVAAGACVGHDVWLFFRGKKSIRRALPLLCVPTVAGSGSECNHGVVLTNQQQRQKIGLGNRHLLPAVAIMDPELTGSVNWQQTLFGAVDTMGHLLEIFCTSRPCGLQDRLALALFKGVLASVEKLRDQPADYQGRAELLWASSLALSGLNSAGRGRVSMPAHLLAHALGGLHDLPHGAALSVILPAWLSFIVARDPEQAKRVAAWAGAVFSGNANTTDQGDSRELGTDPGINATGFSDTSISDTGISNTGIRAWRNWLTAMGAPATLADLGLSEEPAELAALADHARPQARLWRLPYSQADLLAILRHAQRENSPAGPL